MKPPVDPLLTMLKAPTYNSFEQTQRLPLGKKGGVMNICIGVAGHYLPEGEARAA